MFQVMKHCRLHSGRPRPATSSSAPSPRIRRPTPSNGSSPTRPPLSWNTRAQNSTSLRAVVFQRLYPRADGNGRVAASELLLRTPAVSTLIRKGKFAQLGTAITTGQRDGMVTLERDIERLVKEGSISVN